MIRNIFEGSEFLLYDIHNNPIALSKNCALKLKQNLVDITTKDSDGWKENLTSIKDWSIEFDGLISYDDDKFNTAYFLSQFENSEPFFIQFGVIQNGFAHTFWGEVALSSIELNAESGEVASHSGTLKGIGQLGFTNQGTPTQSGYLKTETDPVFRGSASFNITETNKSDWFDAYNKTLTEVGFNTVGNKTTLNVKLRDGSVYSTFFNQTNGSGSADLSSYYTSIQSDSKFQPKGNYVGNQYLSDYYFNKSEADSRYLMSVDWSIVGNKPDLFSGNYNDLFNKPLIPINVSQLFNDSGYVNASIVNGLASVNFVENGLNAKANVADVYNKATADSKFHPLENQRLSTGNDVVFSKIKASSELVIPASSSSTNQSIWLGEAGTNNGGGNPSIISYLKDLQDVALTNLADGESLVYNAGAGKWLNKKFAIAADYALANGSNANGNWAINISGNAASASSVAWSNITNKPTALSQFSNDLGLGSFAYRNSINGVEVNTSIIDKAFDIGVAKYLRWNQYGNRHVLFDASAGTAPDGRTISSTPDFLVDGASWNQSASWGLPIRLMGWNGTNTYEIVVGRSRFADSAGNSNYWNTTKVYDFDTPSGFALLEGADLNPTNAPRINEWGQGIQFSTNNNPAYANQLVFSVSGSLWTRTKAGGTYGSWDRVTTNSQLGTNAYQSKAYLSEFVNDLGNYGNWITAAQGSSIFQPLENQRLSTNSNVTFNYVGVADYLSAGRIDTSHWNIQGVANTAYIKGNGEYIDIRPSSAVRFLSIFTEAPTVEINGRTGKVSANEYYGNYLYISSQADIQKVRAIDELIIPASASGNNQSIWLGAAGSNGSNPAGDITTLASLQDVAFSNLANGQSLQYNSSTGRWNNVTYQIAGNYQPLENQRLSSNNDVRFNELTTTNNLKTYGRLFVNANDAYGANAVISLAVGDSDTGFNSAGDGVTTYWSNNQALYNLNDASSIRSFLNLNTFQTPTFNQVYADKLFASRGDSSINGYSWTDAALTTSSIEIVTSGSNIYTDRSPTLAFHRYGSGGSQFRLDATGSQVLYLESANTNSARKGDRYGGGANNYFAGFEVDGFQRVNGSLTVGGETTLNNVLRLHSASSNYFYNGGHDNASYSQFNLGLKLWWGFGLTSYDDVTRGFYDSRSGTWDVKSDYMVDGNSYRNTITKLQSTSHNGTYWLQNTWDGVNWWLHSNHGAAVKVGEAVNSANWNGTPVNWADDGVSSINDVITMGNNGVVGRSNVGQIQSWLGLGSLAYRSESIDTAEAAYSLAQRNNAGHLFATFFNSTDTTIQGFTPTALYAYNGSDGYLRKVNQAGIRNFLSLGASAYEDTTLQIAANRGSTIVGRVEIGANSSSSGYNEAGLIIREAFHQGGGQTQPRLSFHWSGVVASQIALDSDGWFRLINNPGTGRESLRLQNLQANGDINSAGNIITSNRFIAYGGTHFTGNHTVDVEGLHLNWNEPLNIGGMFGGVSFINQKGGGTGGFAWMESGTNNSRFTSMKLDGYGSLFVTNDLFVGEGKTSSNIYMRDGDETGRTIHCNSNRVGFLNAGGGWGSYCDNTGNWLSDFAIGGQRIFAGYDGGLANAVYASNWFRSNGGSGWINETYGGGIHMVDSQWVRIYGGKAFLVENNARVGHGGDDGGLDIMGSRGYSRIRFHQNGVNSHTIHSFGDDWENGNPEWNNTFNLDPSANGKVTLGSWNNRIARFDNTNKQTNFYGAVIGATGTNGGFSNSTFHQGHNNIWRLNSDVEYGIGYYQAWSGANGYDAIGFHFGNRQTPAFYATTQGNAKASNSIEAPTLKATSKMVIPTSAPAAPENGCIWIS